MTQELRFALRRLRYSPGFAISAVTTLALGLGATVAVCAVIEAKKTTSSPPST